MLALPDGWAVMDGALRFVCRWDKFVAGRQSPNASRWTRDGVTRRRSGSTRFALSILTPKVCVRAAN
jgi:hypothetical protein